MMSEKAFNPFEDVFEDVLDSLRSSIYQEIKDMTPEEETAYFREQTASVFEKFDIKRSSLMPVKPRRRERIAG